MTPSVLGLMARHERTLRQVLTAEADANVGFSDLRTLPKGAKAKPYQVRQVRALINRYRLRLQ